MSHAFYETMKETKSLGIQLGFYSVPAAIILRTGMTSWRSCTT